MTSQLRSQPLPMSPLSNVVSGQSPLSNRLHVRLLVWLWLVPGSMVLAAISLYVGPQWGLLASWMTWLLGYAAVAAVLTMLVGRGGSVIWTLVVHAAVLMVLCALPRSGLLEVLAFAVSWIHVPPLFVM